MLGLVCFSLAYYWLRFYHGSITALALMSILCLSFSFSCVNAPDMLLSLLLLPEDKVGMATGLFSWARGIANPWCGVIRFFLEYRRSYWPSGWRTPRALDLPVTVGHDGAAEVLCGRG